MPTASEEKAKELTRYFDEKFPGAGTFYAGPDKPEDPKEHRFELAGVSKRIVIDEKAFEAWGSSKPMLEKAFHHFDLLGQLDAGPGEYRIVREGQKIKVER